MDNLLVLAGVALVVLFVLHRIEAPRKGPAYAWSFHCGTCNLRGSTNDELTRDNLLRPHLEQGHQAGKGWTA